MNLRYPVALLCGTALAPDSLAQTPAASNTRVTPGELVVDPPTLVKLGFEWLVDGDANRNAEDPETRAAAAIPYPDA